MTVSQGSNLDCWIPGIKNPTNAYTNYEINVKLVNLFNLNPGNKGFAGIYEWSNSAVEFVSAGASEQATSIGLTKTNTNVQATTNADIAIVFASLKSWGA